MRRIMLTFISKDVGARDVSTLQARPRSCLHRAYVPVQTPLLVTDVLALATQVWGEHARRAAAFDPRVTTHNVVSVMWAGPRGRIVPLTADDVLLIDAIGLTHGTRPIAPAADGTHFDVLSADEAFDVLRVLPRKDRRAAMAASHRLYDAWHATIHREILTDEVFIEMTK